VKDDAEEGAIDLQAAVVFDEAELAEFVHEEIDAGAGGADHFGKHFLRDLGKDVFGFIFLAVAGEEKEGAGEALFAGIEELVDEIFLDANVAREHVGDEAIGEGMLGVKDANHFLLFDDEDGGGSDGGGGGDAVGLSGEAAFAEEVARAENGDDGFFAGFVDDGEADAAFLDVKNVGAEIALGKDGLFLFEGGDGAGDTGGVEKFLGVKGGFGSRFGVSRRHGERETS